MSLPQNRLWLVPACFLLSGLAGLVYEIAWTQQFALVFGTSELAVVAVLAAYMAGLAAGAAGAARWAGRLRRPLWVYAALELGIAATSLLVPSGLKLASLLQVALLGGAEMAAESASLASAVFYLLSAFVILFVPTALMGASLPVLVRYAVRSKAQIGSRPGWLYAVNTGGAACGTLLAAFVLLPGFGLAGTIWFAVGVNLAVVLIILLLAGGRTGPPVAPVGQPVISGRLTDSSWILPLMFFSGAVAFTCEVLWTRLLSHLLGGTLYAFATMLATFLCGITLGSALASLVARTRAACRRIFIGAQLGAALCSLAAFHAADQLPALADGLNNGGGALANMVLLAAATLLPGALFLGATFPLAVRMLARSANEASAASGQVLAWNTAGAIVGAVGSGFFALPALHFAGTMLMAACASVLLALVAAVGPAPRQPRMAVLVLVALLVTLWWRPQMPTRLLRTTPMTGQPLAGDITFSAVGRSATVALLTQAPDWRLTSNGLAESIIEARGSRAVAAAVAQWLGVLPLAAQPDAKSVLVIGFGGGRTLESIAPTVQQIHVVELEPQVIRANRLVAPYRETNPFADPRLTIHLNDARSGLQLADRQYDAIISQPSHPWTAGAGHLFTREFFDLVRRRLTPGGVFVQWIGLSFVDESLLSTLLASLNDAFPYVELYMPPRSAAVIFTASVSAPVTAESAARGAENSAALWRRLGILDGDDILAARVLDSVGSRRFAAGAPINRDDRNWLRLRPPGRGLVALGQRDLLGLLAPYDALQNWQPQAGNLYRIRRLLAIGQVARARRAASAIHDDQSSRIAQALVGLVSPRAAAAAAALEQALLQDPGSDEAFFALVLWHQLTIIAGSPPPAIAARLLTDPVARAVVGGWRLSSSGRSLAIRKLEPDLAGIEPTHPLYANAVRLRVAWRLASGEAAPAAEGIALYDPILALRANPQELLIRARLGMVAGKRATVVATLFEIAGRIGPAAQPSARHQAVARAALKLLDALAAEASSEPTIAGLRRQLQSVLPGGGP